MEKVKVLYEEDEPFLGRIVKESLESREFQVHMITDGAKVIQVFGQLIPDVVVLDIMLPNKDGFTLAKEIKSRFPDLPIIFLSAKNQTKDVLTGFTMGGNDYLKKPFSMEELIVRIKNILHLKQIKNDVPHDLETLELGRFTLYPKKYEISKNGQTKKLSFREKELLKMIFLSKNKILSRKEILMQLWGDDSFYNSRNLDVYITKIREYLKDDPYIEILTIRGVGYHIIVGS